MCDRYVPPGSFYGHADTYHHLDPDGQPWNDHMVNAMDSGEVYLCLPWVIDAWWEKKEEACKDMYRRWGYTYNGQVQEERKQREEHITMKKIEVRPGLWRYAADHEFDEKIKTGEIHRDGSYAKSFDGRRG